jgi:hypothetical protein
MTMFTKIKLALFVASLSSATGCGGATLSASLGKAVHEMAPSFRFKAPASSDADLGRELRDEKPLTNACFDGDRGEGQPASSWSKLEASYEDVSGAKLKADFGSILKVPASASAEASSKQGATVTLTNIKLDQLSGVFLNPKSACATDATARAAFESPSGTMARVITKAIKAGTIDVKTASSASGQLSIDLPGAPGGGASTNKSSAGSLTVNGVNLYVADFSECFKVTHQTQVCKDKPVGPGSACDVATCSFQVKTFDPKTNQVAGALSCQGDSKPSEITAALGGYAGEKTAPGVSYSVRVTNGQGLNAVTIELHIWNVLSVAPDACK